MQHLSDYDYSTFVIQSWLAFKIEILLYRQNNPSAFLLSRKL